MKDIGTLRRHVENYALVHLRPEAASKFRKNFEELAAGNPDILRHSDRMNREDVRRIELFLVHKQPGQPRQSWWRYLDDLFRICEGKNFLSYSSIVDAAFPGKPEPKRRGRPGMWTSLPPAPRKKRNHCHQVRADRSGPGGPLDVEG